MAMFNKNKLALIDLSQVKRDYAWYAVVTVFNHEEKYVLNVQDYVKDSPLENLISEYYIPIKYSKEIIHKEDGSTKTKIHKVKGCYSNYVFVKCVMTASMWNCLRTTSGASVILSTGGFPTEIAQSEIDKIKEQQKPEGFTEEEINELISKYKMNVSLDNEALTDDDFCADYKS